MTVGVSQNPPYAAAPFVAQDKDRQRAWFAFALPALMAVLLALVPVIGKLAAGPMLLVMISLVLWSAFRDTERALYVYIAWCWMDGTIRGLLGSDPVSIVARDIVLGIIVVGWGIQRLQSRGQDPVRVPPGILLIVLFTINCLLQVFNPNSLGLIPSIGGLKLHLSPIPVLFLGYDVFRRREQVRALFLFLTLATLVIGLVSFIQYLGGQAWTWAHFPGTHEVISQSMSAMRGGAKIAEIATFKPPGTTTFGGATGVYLGLVFPLIFALLMLTGDRGFTQLFKVVLLGVMMAFIVIILINGVRSALVMAVCGLLVCAVLIRGQSRGRIVMTIVACAILGLLALNFSEGVSQGGVTDRYASTFADPVNALHQDRSTFFEEVGGILANSPMGVGLGRVGGAGRLSSGANNLNFSTFTESYLGMMIYETGIIGGLLITCIALLFITRGYRFLTSLRDTNDQFLVAAILGVLVVIFSNFFLAPILIAPPGSVLFWLLTGVMLRVFSSPAQTLVRQDREPK